MRVRVPVVEHAIAYEHEPYAPVIVVPHEVPVVERAQPAVSVSVAVVLPQLPDWHTGSVRVRVREPVSEQVAAYEHIPYMPNVDVPQLTLSVARLQPTVSVSVFCTAAQVPA